MGMTATAMGQGAQGAGLQLKRMSPNDLIIALAGNPNVGKSTVFNGLTGLHQHTGNWPGKTVAGAQGEVLYAGRRHILIDLPGTYSLLAHSPEEEVARDFLCFGSPDCAVVVADATCLERNLNLVLQVTELFPKAILCLNLMDEAARKHIELDLSALESELGIPVVPCQARQKRGLPRLMETIDALSDGDSIPSPPAVRYPSAVEKAVTALLPFLPSGPLPPHWVALRLLENEANTESILAQYGYAVPHEALRLAREHAGLSAESLKDQIASSLVLRAEEICLTAVRANTEKANIRDRRIDRILTGRLTALPFMLSLLAFVFFLTIRGANIPSEYLSAFLIGLKEPLRQMLSAVHLPVMAVSALTDGVWQVLATVVSVMLPPMAIFFPLFTLLEDVGYLPRVAFNLDHAFQKAHACGKQSLTMCMGLGCNAAGVVGCRIIDSPRERLIAILTNAFVPCNGRFPTLIAIITMFFAGSALFSSFLLTAVILFSIFMTLLISRLLSGTLLKGTPSSFALELPPYRTPRVGEVIIRSIFDRTLFVLGRAVVAAAPAGLIIWLLANLHYGDASLLNLISTALDPFARFIGLDGIILLAFVLAFPANELVMSLIVMGYLCSGTLTELTNLAAFHSLLLANGWNWVTAVCTILLCLMHWPCSTTCLTIRREAGTHWMVLATLLPTCVGFLLCFLVSTAARILGLI